MDTGDTTRKPRLLDFRKTIHSQFGEDGIIEKIFEIIGTTSKVCVEFGAWDGFFLSNTAALWTKDWKGVLIEAEQNKFLALLDNVRNYSCVPILAKVGIREYQLVSLQSEMPFEITAPLRHKLRGTFHQPIPHVICMNPKRK